MSLLKRLFKKEKQIEVEQEQLPEAQTNSMIVIGSNYASANADMKKLEKSIARKRSNLKIKEVEINSHIEKLDVASEAEEDTYMKALFAQTKKKEQAGLTEISTLLNLTDEEITQGYIDKVTDSYLKNVIKYARKARKAINNRTNPVAKKFVENMKVVVPAETITANINELLIGEETKTIE